MMSEIENKIVDTYKDHLFHEHYEKECSDCYEKKNEIVMGILKLAHQKKNE